MSEPNADAKRAAREWVASELRFEAFMSAIRVNAVRSANAVGQDESRARRASWHDDGDDGVGATAEAA